MSSQIGFSAETKVNVCVDLIIKKEGKKNP